MILKRDKQFTKLTSTKHAKLLCILPHSIIYCSPCKVNHILSHATTSLSDNVVRQVEKYINLALINHLNTHEKGSNLEETR